MTDHQPLTHEHTDLHDCQHDCDCFWCRASRREKFEPIVETQEVRGKP